ncbi:MAG TPA: S8 family peptidase [Drouetiella sp.]
MSNEQRPVKIIVHRDEDYYVPPHGGGGGKKVFCDVTPELRNNLSTQLASIESLFATAFDTSPDVPAVAKVVMKKEALAKSHRPDALLTDRTCPIIGVDQFGELLTQVTPAGLSKLKSRILRDKTKVGQANISAIENIVPYRIVSEVVESLVEKVEQGLKAVKVRLFKHQNKTMDLAILQRFLEIVRESNLPEPEVLNYGKHLRVFRLTEVTPDAVLRLASFVGTQKISEFQTFRMVRHIDVEREAAANGIFKPPSPDREYPVVGVIDSGTNPTDPILSPWRVGRFAYVLPSECDYRHGSFVSGLLAYPSQLNGNDTRIPKTQCKFIDIVALPGEHSSSGGKIREDEAIEMIGESLRLFPEPKVWNLSFGSNIPISEQTFSDFAIALDSLQDEHDVTFVLASGNAKPLRRWPPTQELHGADRICSPADSVRALTVGSVASLGDANSLVRPGDPSPFSRRGPGPAYIPKPEVNHFGGNCSQNGKFDNVGVLSLDGSNHIVESIGTSFSAPLVSNLLANIHHAVKKPMSRNLAKGLLIHSAVLRSDHVEANELIYRGFGVPDDIESILNCPTWASTLVFEGELWQTHDFEKRSFPIPKCFRTDANKVKGEFLMTLVYDPPLNPDYGVEYCRSNMEISLGTYDVGADSKRKHQGKVPPETGDYKQNFESFMIEHGFKWSPVKVYRKSMSGITGDEWRLHVDLQNRADFNQEVGQNFALIISMFDKEKKLPVYNDVVTAMRIQGWETSNLEVRDQLRLSN